MNKWQDITDMEVSGGVSKHILFRKLPNVCAESLSRLAEHCR